MKINTRRAVPLVAAGALLTGALAVTVPALAGAGPLGNPTAAGTPGPGWHGGMMGDGPGAGNGGGAMGSGNGAGMKSRGGMMGAGNGAGMGSRGDCAGTTITAAKGTLTAAQKTTLAAMAEEEKLAHDLYAAFADTYDAMVFDHIAAAETLHLATVRTLLQRYGLTDPTAGKPAGQFDTSAVQATYDKLLAQGRASQGAALDVGVQVERTDIADLRAALDGLTAPDVQQVYTNLVAASERHLAAFTRWSGR